MHLKRASRQKTPFTGNAPKMFVVDCSEKLAVSFLCCQMSGPAAAMFIVTLIVHCAPASVSQCDLHPPLPHLL